MQSRKELKKQKQIESKEKNRLQKQLKKENRKKERQLSKEGRTSKKRINEMERYRRVEKRLTQAIIIVTLLLAIVLIYTIYGP